MARGALARMAEDAVDISARRQHFVPLTIATLGNAGTATDGFDEMFSEAAQHAAEHLGFAETLAPDLKDADFVPGQIVESALGPSARDFQAFTGAGSSVLDEATGKSGSPAAASGAAPPLTALEKSRAVLADVAGGVSLDAKEPFGPAQKENVLEQYRAAREDLDSRANG